MGGFLALGAMTGCFKIGAPICTLAQSARFTGRPLCRPVWLYLRREQREKENSAP